MKKILIITLSLSEKNGVGRYSRELLGRLCKSFELIIFSGKDNESFRSLPNCRVFPILPGFSKFYRLKNPLIFISSVLKILKFSREISLIHSFMDYPHSVLSFVVSIIIRKPLILTAHGTYSIEPFRNKFDKVFHKLALKRASKIICVSKFTEKELKNKINISTTTVINNGISFNKFVDHNLIDNKKKYPQILGVGILKARKGYHVSIPAIAEVKKKYSKIKYYIVGNHDNKTYWDALKSMVKDYALEKNVFFLENINDEKLINLYYSSDIFVLTSVNIDDNFEGFGLVYLEAGACGLPVVGAHGSGAEDAIIDGETGILVPQNDVQKTAEAVLKLLDNSGLARKMGENGREFAKKMNWDNMVKKYVEIYEKESIYESRNNKRNK